MFRKMLRIKQALSAEECIELLKNERRGVLSVLGDDDYPYGLPIDHWYSEAEEKIYFHCGAVGHKLDALARHDKASFCVFDSGFRREGEWALNIRSVIVFGRVREVEDHVRAVEICRQLSRKFTDDEAYIEDEIRRAGSRTRVLELTPEHISGKLVKES